MSIRMALLAALLAAVAGCAAADTAPELYAQAQEPWNEVITAYGREIAIDVTAQMPDVLETGIYRVTTFTAEETVGDEVYRAEPQRKRGYAYRAMPNVVIAYEEIDREAHAYGNPVSAGEALDKVEAFLEPVAALAQGVEICIDEMTMYSPIYCYNKKTGEWGEQVYEDEVGKYGFSLTYAKDGVQIMQRGTVPMWRENRAEPEPASLYWGSMLFIDENGYEVKTVSVPGILETVEQGVELASLQTVKESLRELACRGLLRDVVSMQLMYVSFGYSQEKDVWELRPTWVCKAEIYWDEKDGPENHGYMTWIENVFIDARSGEVIQARWADGEPSEEENEGEEGNA